MNGTVVHASGARNSFLFFPPSGTQRKELRRGRSKSLHGCTVILLLISPGWKSLASVWESWNRLQRERVFYADLRGGKGQKGEQTSDVGAASCCYFLQEKGLIESRRTGEEVCAGCRGFQLPVRPSKVSSVVSLLSKWLRIVAGFSGGFPNVFASCQRGQLQGPRRLTNCSRVCVRLPRTTTEKGHS